MKMKNDIEEKQEKKQNTFSNILKKAADISKQTAESVQKGTSALVEKAKQDSQARKLQKLNPIFPKDYKSKNFNIPNIIKIVDDAERRNIEICDGAIGWRKIENQVEVLYLYDEAVKMSGLTFIPTITCNAVYCVYPFDRKCFIQADCIFSKTHEEKLAELEHIAYSLGAKKCSIEIDYSNYEFQSSSMKIGSHDKKVGVDSGKEQGSKVSSKNSGRISVEFEGTNTPIKPNLKWFAHDDNIKNLIDMRCSNSNSIKSKVLELSGVTSATMSQQTALAIDMIIKKSKIKNKSATQNESQKEMQSKLIFAVEF